MLSHKCPGQDRRYWTADDVYEIECPECGYMIEFFKIDLLRRCPGCGYMMVNPRFNLGCARWCDGAELCLGSTARLLGETGTIRKKVEEGLQKILTADPQKIEHLRQVTARAEELAGGRANLLLVILAALLHEQEKMSEARRIMEENSLPLPVIEEVFRIINDLHSGEKNSELANIIFDAHRLSEMEQTGEMTDDLRTEDGRAMARKLKEQKNQ